MGLDVLWSARSCVRCSELSEGVVVEGDGVGQGKA